MSAEPGETAAEDTFEYETGEDREKKPLIPGGCTFGRATQGCIAFNYFLIFLSSLIVSGTLGVLNYKLAKNYPDHDTTSAGRTCILYSSCSNDMGDCSIHYNNSGGCNFIVGGFGIIAFAALVYIVISFVRCVFATNIWMTVVVDILVNVVLMLCVLVMGITISVGLAFTCGEVKRSYDGALSSCSARSIPHYIYNTTENKEYLFYSETNISQCAAWFCFMFTVFGLLIFSIRSCIYCRRRSTVVSMPHDFDVLTAEDNYKNTHGDEEDVSKPV